MFDAALVGVSGVRRRIAVRDDQTLVDLHDAMGISFDWDDDHLYSFWLNGRFWSGWEEEFTHPWHAANPGPLVELGFGGVGRSADVALAELGLTVGQRLAYVFDFGDEWRVRLTVKAVEPDAGLEYPVIVSAKGVAPPQYRDAA